MTTATIELLDVDDHVLATAESTDFAMATKADGSWAVVVRALVAIGEDDEATQARLRREDGTVQSWVQLEVPATGQAGCVVDLTVTLHMGIGDSMWRRAGVER